MDIEKQIFDKIRFTDHVSFAEIERLVDDSHIDKEFDHSFKSKKYKNIFFWVSRKKVIIDSIVKLIREDKIQLKPTTKFIYLIDGHMLNMPLAKKGMDYKNPRWCPVILSPTEKYKPTKNESELYNKGEIELLNNQIGMDTHE